MRKTSTYTKNLCFPRDCREGPSLHGVSSCFCQVAHHRPGGQKDDRFLQPTYAPIYTVGKGVPVSAHYACRKEQQLPWRFAFPGSLASAQYVQPWPAMAGFLNRLLLTASLFLHVIWALECNGRIQPDYIWIPQSSMLELLLTLKGPDLSTTCLVLLQKHTKVYEHKFTRELQPCIYFFILDPKIEFSLCLI